MASMKAAMAELLRTADAFATIIGLPPGFYITLTFRTSHVSANFSPRTKLRTEAA
jgi:hypothetical protein